MNGLIKICGITDAMGMDAALHHGADMIGFVFREGSLRNIRLDTAAQLAQKTRGRAQLAAVVVNPDDAFLEKLVETVNPDIFQLHGSETPHRVADISVRFGKKIIKALGLSKREDVDTLTPYKKLCAHILVEACNSEGLPCGGQGRIFDWKLLADLPMKENLFLAGGLNADNIAEAITTTHVGGVDVSSGVEAAPGIKDEQKIAAFVAAARAAYAKQSFQRVSA
ncbi:MAG: phosphoribosylanthranilate isomerase [Pseudomonadota bacterium]